MMEMYPESYSRNNNKSTLTSPKVKSLQIKA